MTSPVRKNDEEQARLIRAVQDAPTDAATAFSLGASSLRELFSTPKAADDDDATRLAKTAQIQLLQAAKLDSTQANPFALLGYWYECWQLPNHKKSDDVDRKRAVGCYAKALKLDPGHPIAGRGIVRLLQSSPEKTLSVAFLQNATDQASPTAGWAWRETARLKTIDGDDDLAVVALLRALRCSDILEKDPSGLAQFFYTAPSDKTVVDQNEKATTLAELAACYRRLGRYTAAIRSFHASIESWQSQSDAVVPPHVWCSCAQVELELGLDDDAADKFAKAMAAISSNNAAESTTFGVWARYGYGVALYASSQRHFAAGKVGLALTLVERAIASCFSDSNNGSEDETMMQWGAVHKLLGDLYTFGAVFPARVLADSPLAQSDSSNDPEQILLDFVARGEVAYRRAEQLADRGPDSDENALQAASLATDCGTNKLLRAHLLHSSSHRTIQQSCVTVPELFDLAAYEFRRAIAILPTHASAWCGLGCAVAVGDPVLAQHAFCRSIELENQFASAYSNLSFLYTRHGSLFASASVGYALTQVADTPFNWINQAFILEQQAETNESATKNLGQAADAYKAALQVEKHPCAMLGVALANTWSTIAATGDTLSSDVARHQESYAFTSEYLGSKGESGDPSMSILNSLLLMELGLENAVAQSDDCIEEARRRVAAGRAALAEKDHASAAGTFDLDLIDQILSSTMNSSDNVGDEPCVEEAFPGIGLARQIIHFPQRGDLWLRLAKELALKVPASLPQALAAARRATRSLSQAMATADELSDAIALTYWLESIMDGEAKTESSGPAVDLQRSLLLCPTNLLAREALGHKGCG